jgi:hypothetical protein
MPRVRRTKAQIEADKAKEQQSVVEPIANIITKAKEEAPASIEDMPLNSLADYMAYNARAREMNKKLKIRRYAIKPCPIELHPKERIIFARKDQPLNPLPVYLSDDMIDFKETLVPGKTYDLPVYVLDYLASKGTPIWKWFENPDGSKETRIAAYDPRFSLRTVRDNG